MSSKTFVEGTLKLAKNRSRAARRIRVATLATTLALVATITPGGATGAGLALAATAEPNSADRMVVWSKCAEFAKLTDAELDLWKGRGMDGFACVVGHLRGMGGTQDFTGDPGAGLQTGNYSLQRTLRDSDVVRRAAARGMKAYLGAYLGNYWNRATPLSEWFDDGGWSAVALPRMGDLAAAAKGLGFAGLAFDQELYAQDGGATATWGWDYPGRTRPEPEVRAKVRQRGRELMTRILAKFPGVELLAYDVEFPGTWGELVQKVVNGTDDAFAPRVDIDFWDGLSSVEGYGAIRLIDATFYKTPHVGTWDTAFQYHYNRLYSYLSRRLSNWSYASSRLFVSPFAWIDRGPCGCAFDEARSPAYVTAQLEAFRRWGMGGEFANYAYAGLDDFDYSPYVEAMRSASTPAVVDSVDPTLRVGAVNGGAGPLELEGTAVDNLAIRAVRWSSDRGVSGTARLNWRVRSGDYSSGYDWEMHWSVPALSLAPGENRITVTAEDIKGRTTTVAVTVIGP